MNVPESRFPALVDAARQQTELVIWVAKTLQEHEIRIDDLARHVAALPSAAPAASAASRLSRLSRGGSRASQARASLPSSLPAAAPGSARPSPRASPLARRSAPAGAAQLGEEEARRLVREPTPPAPQASEPPVSAPDEAEPRPGEEEEAEEEEEEAAEEEEEELGGEEEGELEEEALRGRSSAGSALEALMASARGSREIAPSASDPDVGEVSPPLAEEGEADLNDDLELEPAQAERIEARRAESQRPSSRSRELASAASAAVSPDEGLALLGRRMSSAAGGAELESQPWRRTSQSERAAPSPRRPSTTTPPAQLEQRRARRSSTRHDEAKPARHPPKDGRPDPPENPHGRHASVELEERIKASDELLIHAVEELRKRIEPLEDAFGDIADGLAKLRESARGVKEVRLQSADLRMDLDTLQESVSEISSALQSLEAAREKDLRPPSVRPPGEGPADLESAREGLSVLSTEAGRSSTAGRRSSLPPSLLRPSKAAPLPMQAAHTAELSEEQLLMLEGLGERVAKLEAEAKAREESAAGDLEELLPKLEEKLEALEADYRGTSAAMQSRIEMLNVAEEHRNEEDAKSSRVWNLANQVDVIQSVVSQEMRGVRAELLGAVREQLQLRDPQDGGEVGHRHTLRRKASIAEALGAEEQKADIATEVKDIDEKVKRLQDCYQQCTLKLAALKTAHRHSEQQAGIAVDRVKRLGEEVEYLIERSYVWDGRPDRWAPRPDGGAPAELQPSPRTSHLRSPRAARDSHGGTHVGDEKHHGGPPGTPAHGGGGRGLRRHNSPQPRVQELAAPEVATAAAAPAPAAEPRAAEGGQAQGSPKAEDAKESDSNTSRIMRLGKKVSELDGEVHAQVRSLHEDLEVVSQKLGMITTFLPRRQRRIVERILAAGHKGKDDEAGADDEKGEKRAEGPKRVQFAEQLLETRTYHVSEEEHRVPWQTVAEPEQKWHWCMQPMTELGSALAQHFELMEHERAEFEQEVARNLEQLQEQLGSGAGGPRRAQRRSSAPRASAAEDGEDGDGFLDLMSQDGLSSLCARVQKAVLPQLAVFEDRVERLVSDLREVKKQQEKDRSEKLDKAEFQLMAMRVAVFEKLDPKQLEDRLAGLEASGESLGQQLGQVAADQRRVEANGVHRNDFAKAKTEHTVLKGEHQKLHANVNDLSTQIFGANKTLSTTLAEAKSNFERAVSRLEKEKATMWEYSNLLERLNKLEGSMRDNRQILSGAGAQDVNAFVKRIILNMEDKLMVLEKKIDCLADGRTRELQGETGAPADPPATAPARGSFSAPAQEGQVQALGAELAAISQAMTQLKQEVHLSKVDMDRILEQGQLHADLAQRLNVYVEKAGADEVAGAAGGGEQGAVLSMNRVQVMISAAARQLVAGSKWVTKEIFDARFGELRKECLGTSRQLQAQLEELGGLILKGGAAGGGAGASAAGLGPKLPRMLAKRQAPEAAPEAADWPPSMPLDPGPEKQNRYLVKDRPPGTAPAQAAGLGGPGARRAGQQRPPTERGSPRDRAWAG